MAGRLLALTVGAAVVLGAAPAAGGGRLVVRTDAVYESSGRTHLTFVPLSSDDGGETVLKLTAEFRCEEQEVVGDLLVTADADGEFEVETTAFVTTADVGSETEVTVQGRLTRTGGRGTIDAHVRAYDNAGTTAECERELRWRVRPTENAALERVDGFVETRDADWFTATDDAIYLASDGGTKSDELRRIDPDTGDEAWSQEVEAAEEVAAGSASVWGASPGDGLVVGYAAEEGDPITEIEVAGDYDAIGTAADSPIVVTADAVWVATAPGTVRRLDPETGDVIAEIEVGGEPDANLSLAATESDVVVAIEGSADDNADGIPIDLARIDPATNQVVTKRKTTGQVQGIAITGDVLTLTRFDDRTQRFALDSLRRRDEIDVVGHDVVGVGAETWIATGNGLVVIDESGATVLELPAVSGSLATAGGVVFVLDGGAGGIVRLSGGGTAE